ncbi:unnamed protein product, partial [Brenthis ino]
MALVVDLDPEFELPNDMENYMRYHIMGTVDRVMLKPGCLPKKFQCQKRSLPSTVTSCPAAIKMQRLALEQEALDYSTLESDTKEVNTTLSSSLPVEVIVEHQPKNKDKGVQVFVKSKYFRSKLTQTEFKSHSIATSPSKTWMSTVSTSPFKVEHVKPATPSHRKLVLDRSDSDTSLYSQSMFQQMSPSVQSLQLKSLSESSSLNEEEAILEKKREAKQSLENKCKKIKAKPRFYIGINNNCYFLLHLIEKETNIPIVNILLCLKKIRLNTTFSELSDQFGISMSYAGKIFRKCVPTISAALKSFIEKLDKKKIKSSLPIAFRHRYNKVNCIIDCFEIEIEKPSKSVHQALTWSEYKKGNTIKYLISSTPNGLVNYISPGYGGRISDTLLVEHSEFLDQLEPGSWVLADCGFKHIKQLLIQKNCHLLRPPSVIQGAKLSKKEVHQTKQIASLRIHIERVIRRIREFSMLKPHSVLNSKLISVLDECVIISCALINLQDSIVY